MTDASTARTTARLWTGAYLVATFGSAALAKTGVLPGWPGLALFASSFLLLIPLMRSVERAQDVCGVRSKAVRRYNRRVLIASMIYIVLLLGGISLARYYAPPAIVRVALAIIVSLPVMGIIAAMALLLKEETDEYLRMRMVEQSLIATGFLLTVATLYGFLNAFDLAPQIDSWAAVPVWALGLGVGRIFRKEESSC
ncbi:MAG: hypothetical protein ACJ8EY_03700 [Sphingomicrobium sp.]